MAPFKLETNNHTFFSHSKHNIAQLEIDKGKQTELAIGRWKRKKNETFKCTIIYS